MPKRQRPDQSVENSQGQPMGLQQNEKIPHPDRNKDI